MQLANYRRFYNITILVRFNIGFTKLPHTVKVEFYRTHHLTHRASATIVGRLLTDLASRAGHN